MAATIRSSSSNERRFASRIISKNRPIELPFVLCALRDLFEGQEKSTRGERISRKQDFDILREQRDIQEAVEPPLAIDLYPDKGGHRDGQDALGELRRHNLIRCFKLALPEGGRRASLVA